MDINGVIKTKLSCKEIALIAVALGNYQNDCHDDEMKASARKLVDRLGYEMYSYPKNDFTKPSWDEIYKEYDLFYATLKTQNDQRNKKNSFKSWLKQNY